MNSGSWFWPDVSTLDGAKNAARYGMWCAIFVAGMTALVALIAMAGNRVLGIGPSALVDAGIFAAIAYGLSKYSRFAAVAGFALFLLEKLYMMRQGTGFAGLAMAVIIAIGLLNSIRGTFAYQKLQVEASTANGGDPGASGPRPLQM